MAIRTSCVALLLSTLPIAGCGTVANLFSPYPGQGGTSPFGGVRQDVSCLKKTANGDSAAGKHSPSQAEECRQTALMLLCAADLPLSLVGDVVTWPYTAAYTFINQPIPTPPVMQAQPILMQPVTQVPAEVQPQNPPLDTLPPPRKLP